MNDLIGFPNVQQIKEYFGSNWSSGDQTFEQMLFLEDRLGSHLASLPLNVWGSTGQNILKETY